MIVAFQATCPVSIIADVQTEASRSLSCIGVGVIVAKYDPAGRLTGTGLDDGFGDELST